MTLWYSIDGKLGYSRFGGSGWCSLVLTHSNNVYPFDALLGNDMWLYLTIFLVPVIFVSLYFYLRFGVCYMVMLCCVTLCYIVNLVLQFYLSLTHHISHSHHTHTHLSLTHLSLTHHTHTHIPSSHIHTHISPSHLTSIPHISPYHPHTHISHPYLTYLPITPTHTSPLTHHTHISPLTSHPLR